MAHVRLEPKLHRRLRLISNTSSVVQLKAWGFGPTGGADLAANLVVQAATEREAP